MEVEEGRFENVAAEIAKKELNVKVKVKREVVVGG